MIELYDKAVVLSELLCLCSVDLLIEPVIISLFSYFFPKQSEHNL